MSSIICFSQTSICEVRKVLQKSVCKRSLLRGLHLRRCSQKANNTSNKVKTGMISIETILMEVISYFALRRCKDNHFGIKSVKLQVVNFFVLPHQLYILQRKPSCEALCIIPILKSSKAHYHDSSVFHGRLPQRR